MSTAITFIPAFAATTLLLGGLNELSIQLVLVGILGIILHTAITPIDLTSPYPNFDNYHPTQPPFRDYVLVFGLASLALVALFPRIHPLVSGMPLLHLHLALTSVPRLLQLRSLARSYLALKVRVRSSILAYETISDPFIGYHNRPQPPSHPSHPLPFAHLHRSVDRQLDNPRRRIP